MGLGLGSPSFINKVETLNTFIENLKVFILNRQVKAYKLLCTVIRHIFLEPAGAVWWLSAGSSDE